MQWPSTEPSPEQHPQQDPDEEASSSWGRLPTVALIPIAALVWWVVGFLPWILDGLRISPTGGTPVLAVPLFAGSLSAMVLGGGLGGLAAGMVALLGRGTRWRRAAAVTSGVVIAVAVALLQSALTLRDPSPSNMSAADRVLMGLTVVAIASTIVGLLWGLAALSGRVGLGLALAGVAGAAPWWITAVLAALGMDRSIQDLYGSADVAQWIGVAVLGCALVIIGVQPVVRVVWWLAAVALAWVVGPTITASAYMEQLLRPGTTLSDAFGDSLDVAWQVWRMAASVERRPLTPWVVAIVAAALVSIGIRWARRAPGRPDGPEAVDDPLR
jgi:hypothetical protein